MTLVARGLDDSRTAVSERASRDGPTAREETLTERKVVTNHRREPSKASGGRWREWGPATE